ncbi:MAG: hypothetical protein KJ072_02600 [Verrucomicrobia bacterium]|nr:hypothetical protein [Verrucomicrobiota bacterium]
MEAVPVSEELLPNVFSPTSRADLAVNLEEPEVLVITIDSTQNLTDPITQEASQQAVIGRFHDPLTLEPRGLPFPILGNPWGDLSTIDIEYSPFTGQYVVVAAASSRGDNQVRIPLLAIVNPQSAAGGGSPVVRAFAYDEGSDQGYGDTVIAVSSANGTIMLAAERNFPGEGEGVVGALFDSTGNLLTPQWARLDQLQAIGDEDDPELIYLERQNVFLFLTNTDEDNNPASLKDRVTATVIQTVPDGQGVLQQGTQVVVSADRLGGVAEGHPAAVGSPFEDKVIAALDYGNGARGGDVFYFTASSDGTLTPVGTPEPYLDAVADNDPYSHRHPKLAVDTARGAFVVMNNATGSASQQPNGIGFTFLSKEGAVLPGLREQGYFHAFFETVGLDGLPTSIANDPDSCNLQYDPFSQSFIAVYSDSAAITYLLRLRLTSHHGGNGPAPIVPENGVPPGAFPNQSVTAALWKMDASFVTQWDGTDQDEIILTLKGEGPVRWSNTRWNEGDLAPRLSPSDPDAAQANLGFLPSDFTAAFGGYQWQQDQALNGGWPANAGAWRPHRELGVIMGSIAKNGQLWNDTTPLFYGTFQTPTGSSGHGYSMLAGDFGTGDYDICIGKAGPLSEANIDHATVWFPWDQGWTGGFVAPPAAADGDGAWVSPNSHSPDLSFEGATVVTWTAGQATVRLPDVNSLTDGMLFTVCNDDSSDANIIAADPLADGTGWLVAVREDSQSDPATLAAPAQSEFAFLFVPYTAARLVGGHVRGSDGTMLNQAGQFTLTRLAAGRYQMTIPGKTEADGVLLLGTAGRVAGNQNLASRAFLSYEYDGTANFIIESRYTDAAGTIPLEDTDFYVAWVDFETPLAPVAEAVTDIVLQAQLVGANLILTWDGGGTLETTQTLGGEWSTVQGATSPHSVPATTGTAFFRVKQ